MSSSSSSSSVYSMFWPFLCLGNSGKVKASGAMQKSDANEVDDAEVYVTAEVVRERKRQSGKKRVGAFHLFNISVQTVILYFPDTRTHETERERDRQTGQTDRQTDRVCCVKFTRKSRRTGHVSVQTMEGN